jgi:rRNA-processing protein FCF1
MESINLDSLMESETKVILDANFLFIPIQFNLDIFDELQRILNRRFVSIVLSSTLKELEGLTQSKLLKTQKQAENALKLVDKCKFVSIKKNCNETFDDVIVRISSEWKCIVATNDRNLKQKLREKGVPVIYMRQKKRLELEGSV